MTLCIGALAGHPAFDGSHPWLVYAADWRTGSPEAASDGTVKLDWCHRHWPALIAGNVSAARELLRSYQTHFKPEALNAETLHDLFAEPAILHKQRRIERHVRMTLGMTKQQFLKTRAELGEDLFARTCREMEAIELGCDLIIGGFAAPKFADPVDGAPTLFPLLFRLIGTGGEESLEQREHFAAIGSGSWAAETFLNLRGCRSDMPVQVVIYLLSEALRVASYVAEGVSRKTFPLIAAIGPAPSNRDRLSLHAVSKQGMDVLHEMWHLFGPRKVPADLGVTIDDLTETIDPRTGKASPQARSDLRHSKRGQSTWPPSPE